MGEGRKPWCITVRERQSTERRASPNFPLNLRHTRAAERHVTCLEFNSALTRCAVHDPLAVIHPGCVDILQIRVLKRQMRARFHYHKEVFSHCRPDDDADRAELTPRRACQPRRIRKGSSHHHDDLSARRRRRHEGPLSPSPPYRDGRPRRLRLPRPPLLAAGVVGNR